MIIAFVAFLDQKSTQNEEMIDRFSQVDSLDQTKARNDIKSAEGSQESANSIQNQPTTCTHNTDS